VKIQTMPLDTYLDEQLALLRSAADAFDKGDHLQALNMAIRLRVILHDSHKSKSVLNLLKIKDIAQLYDTSIKIPGVLVGPYEGLVFKSSTKYLAFGDDLPPSIVIKRVKFDEWWNMVVFIDNKKQSHSRKEIVLAVANKDGGGHVDLELKPKYFDLSRNNALGWKSGLGEDLKYPVHATIRQITHEVLKTFINDYPIKKLLSNQQGPVFGPVFFKPSH
jgi:hypothetical protein